MLFVSKCPTKRVYGQVGQNGLATWGQLDMEISKISRKKRIDWMGMLCARVGYLPKPQVYELLKPFFRSWEQANIMKGMKRITCNRTTATDEEDRVGHIWRLSLVL